jgi:hypothetical protein
MTCEIEYQIQEQQSFEQIVPIWFEYLTEGAKIELLDIVNQKYCIVGESHRFKGYDCKDCKDFSTDFVDLFSKVSYTKDELNDNKTVREFVKHWNNKHKPNDE